VDLTAWKISENAAYENILLVKKNIFVKTLDRILEKVVSAARKRTLGTG
jgi:hypothetical protein